MLKTAQSIGIVEMGGKGSILRTTAVTHAIREVNPSVDTYWFTNNKNVDILQYVPGIIPINIEQVDTTSLRSLIENLDVVLNFELNNSAKNIVQHAKRIGGFTLNQQGKFHGVYPYAEEFQRLQVDDYFRKHHTTTMQEILLKSVGLYDSEPHYDVLLHPDNYQRADELLKQAFNCTLPAGIIGLNIGTSERGMARRWPIEYHVELAENLVNRHPDIGVAILSGPEDEEARLEMINCLKLSKANLAILPNNLDVGDFIGILSKLKLLVTSNTFALHAAHSQKVPLISFENPLPFYEMELRDDDIQLSHNLPCGPCYNKCTQLVFAQCMHEITAEEVLTQIEKWLEK